MRYIFIVSLLLIPMLTFGCSGDSSIDMVKNGTLSLDKSISIGNAFNNYKYFKNKKWELLTDPQGRKYVQFTAENDLRKIFSDAKDTIIMENYISRTKNAYQILLNEKDSPLNNKNYFVAQFLIDHNKNGFQPVYVGYKDIIPNTLSRSGNETIHYVIKQIYENKSNDMPFIQNEFSFVEVYHEKITQFLGWHLFSKEAKSYLGEYSDNKCLNVKIKDITKEHIRVDYSSTCNNVNEAKENVIIPANDFPVRNDVVNGAYFGNKEHTITLGENKKPSISFSLRNPNFFSSTLFRKDSQTHSKEQSQRQAQAHQQEKQQSSDSIPPLGKYKQCMGTGATPEARCFEGNTPDVSEVNPIELRQDGSGTYFGYREDNTHFKYSNKGNQLTFSENMQDIIPTATIISVRGKTILHGKDESWVYVGK